MGVEGIILQVTDYQSLIQTYIYMYKYIYMYIYIYICVYILYVNTIHKLLLMIMDTF